MRILLLLIVLGLAGCDVYNNVYATSDEDTDFSKYKTYAWLPDRSDSINLPYNNEIIRNNIRNYFGKCFAERGYTLNVDSPDVLLRLSVENKKREQTNVYYSTPYYYRPYYYGSIYYSPYPTSYYYRSTFPYPSDAYYTKTEYIEGSITLNVLDRRQGKLVWTGTATGDIYDPSYINESIHPAVKDIMDQYPVQPLHKKGSRTKDEVYSKKEDAKKE
jgi:hypothetical protein